MQFRFKRTSSYWGEFRAVLQDDGRDGSYPMYNYYQGSYPAVGETGSGWASGLGTGTMGGYTLHPGSGHPYNGWWGDYSPPWEDLNWTDSDYRTNGQDWRQ